LGSGLKSLIDWRFLSFFHRSNLQTRAGWIKRAEAAEVIVPRAGESEGVYGSPKTLHLRALKTPRELQTVRIGAAPRKTIRSAMVHILWAGPRRMFRPAVPNARRWDQKAEY